ncbi:hypothetical protein [Microbacterium sp.]|uniref:hypothetical protein n=1 Tax=Microbacterium sp. TaxID=51671 RepID=UPI003A8E9B94
MTTTDDPHGIPPAGVSASLALVIAFVSFAALTILGLGMLSFFADLDILAVPGLDWWPGIVGMIVAIGVFAWMLWPTLKNEHPSYMPVFAVGLVSAVAHVVAVWLGALLSGAGTEAAFAAVVQLVTQGSSGVVLGAALLGSWFAIALRRTGAQPPTWPWEHEDPE